jgi:hypothetical protein
MRSRVTCFCVGCKKCIFYDELDIRMFFYDPGASFVSFLSHIFSAKQDIRNCTLCQECVGTYSEEEQQSIIRKEADLLNSLRGKVQWKNREWQLCYPIAQWEEIMKTIKEEGELELHLCCSAALA